VDTQTKTASITKSDMSAPQDAETITKEAPKSE
jgi:hypothetical protein